MKTSRIALVLLVMLALIPCARGFAQTAPAAPAPANVAEFLATLSGSSSDAPGTGVLIPNPTLLSTTCTSNANCPTGQLCCYPCGIDGCSRVCMVPMRGHCPFFP
jgi:hypothetical protein